MPKLGKLKSEMAGRTALSGELNPEGTHPHTAPNERDTPLPRTASRPWLATRSTVWGTGRKFGHRFALVAAASRDVSRSGGSVEMRLPGRTVQMPDCDACRLQVA